MKENARHSNYSVVVWESESSGNTEWVLEDCFDIDESEKGSDNGQQACALWFSCENGLFVLVVSIGSLVHLYSLEGSTNHRYKNITTVETRSCATPSELGRLWFNSY